jgi:hypothetical protein
VEVQPREIETASGVSPITNATLVREAADGGVKYSAQGARADGSKTDATYSAKYGGKEIAVTGSTPTYDTIAVKQVNANTVTEERSKKGGKYHATARIVVSAGGKTMTTTTKGTDADGKALTAVLVFDK